MACHTPRESDTGTLACLTLLASARHMASKALTFFAVIFLASTATLHAARSVPQRRQLIVNGDSVDIAEFPFYASLRVPKPPGEADLLVVLQTFMSGGGLQAPPTTETMHNCGSSLVHENIVLTAAHCVVVGGAALDPSALTIALNSNSYFAKDERAEVLTVSKVIVHPKYQPIVDPDMQVYSPFANDLALLVLTEASMNGTVVDYATPETDVQPGEDAQVIGWGNTVQAPVNIHRGSRAPESLQHSNVTIIGNEKCDAYVQFLSQRETFSVKQSLEQLKAQFMEQFAELPDLKTFMEKKLSQQLDLFNAKLDQELYDLSILELTSKSKICAEDNSPDTFTGVCSGDSGGPLFVERDGKPLLVGAASYVQGCGAGVPDTFARVSSWADTIKEVIAEYGTTATADDAEESTS